MKSIFLMQTYLMQILSQILTWASADTKNLSKFLTRCQKKRSKIFRNLMKYENFTNHCFQMDADQIYFKNLLKNVYEVSALWWAKYCISKQQLFHRVLEESKSKLFRFLKIICFTQTNANVQFPEFDMSAGVKNVFNFKCKTRRRFRCQSSIMLKLTTLDVN